MRMLAATPPRRQRGWVGLIVLLLVVVIVGLLAKNALKQYGLLDSGMARSPTHAPVSGAAGASAAALPGAVDASAIGLDSAAQPPTTALDEARNMGATLQHQADDLAKRMNAAER